MLNPKGCVKINLKNPLGESFRAFLIVTKLNHKHKIFLFLHKIPYSTRLKSGEKYCSNSYTVNISIYSSPIFAIQIGLKIFCITINVIDCYSFFYSYIQESCSNTFSVFYFIPQPILILSFPTQQSRQHQSYNNNYNRLN